MNDQTVREMLELCARTCDLCAARVRDAQARALQAMRADVPRVRGGLPDRGGGCGGVTVTPDLIRGLPAFD